MKLIIGLLLLSTLLVACESKDQREYDAAMRYQAREAATDWCTNISYEVNYTGNSPSVYTCAQLSNMIKLDYFPMNYTITRTQYCNDTNHNYTIFNQYTETVYSGEYKFQYIMRCNESVTK